MWPNKVTVLTSDCNVAGEHGVHTVGYPDTINEWIERELPKEHRLEWWITYYRLCVWEESNIDLFNTIFNVESRAQQWNHLIRCRYNTTWALLGYTEGQFNNVLQLVSVLNTSVFFQKLEVVVYDNSSYYSPIRRLYGKEKTKRKRRPINASTLYARKGRVSR